MTENRPQDQVIARPALRNLNTRQRLLDVASDLFYRYGVRAIGVDLVVERSGVAKTSLYRHFATKDDLVAAVLEGENAAYWVHWDEVALRHEDDALAELEAQLSWIVQDISGPKYRGCPFLNVATEFPSADHPARKVAVEHKLELRRRLTELGNKIRVADVDRFATRLALMIDGVYVNGQLFGAAAPLDELVRTGLDLAVRDRDLSVKQRAGDASPR